MRGRRSTVCVMSQSPAETVTVPSAPRPGRPRRTVLIVVLVVAVLGGAAGTAAWLWRESAVTRVPGTPREAAEIFLDASYDDKPEVQYEMLCAKLQARMSRQGYIKMMEGDFPGYGYEITGVTTGGAGPETATVAYTVAKSNGKHTDLELPLLKEEGQWRICWSTSS